MIAHDRVVAAEQALQEERYSDVIRLAEPIMRTEHDSVDVRSLVAQAHLKHGQPDVALALLPPVSAGLAPHGLKPVLLRARAAAELEDADELRACAHAVTAAPPRGRTQRRAAATLVLRHAPEEVTAYTAALRDWGVTPDDRLLEWIAREDLVAAHEQGAAAFDAALAAARTELERPAAVLVPLLDRLREWDQLAELLTTEPDLMARGLTQLPAGPLQKAAQRALNAGRAMAASVIATQALSAGGQSTGALRIQVSAADQLAVADQGWAWPERRQQGPDDVSDRAVLVALAQSLPIRSGGYATRSHGILAGLRHREWDVRAVTRLGFPYDRWPADDPREVPSVDVVDGIPYHRVLEPGERRYDQHPLSSYIGRYAARLEAHAVEHRAAVIHASSFYVNGLAAGTAARRLGLPFVYELRGLEELMKVSRDPGFAGTDRHRFLVEVETDICRRADLVLVITEALRAELAGRGVSEEKMVVLPNGVHADQFVPRERDPELEAGLGVAGRTVIGYAGGLVDYEGVDLLLDAVASLRAARDDFHVVIVGDGHVERRLHEHAARLGLGGSVTFTGRVPHHEVPRYMSLFDITPFPRLPLPVCELISPIKPFEAMAMAKAAVVSDVAALTEIVRDGETGLVFQKGSAASLAAVLTRLLDSVELRERLGANARSWVLAERDWSDLVGVAAEAYHRLLSRTGAMS